MIYTDNIHLVADSLEELHDYAEKIGLGRHRFEGVKKGHPHYDLTQESMWFLTPDVKTVRPREILRLSKLLAQQKIPMIDVSLIPDNWDMEKWLKYMKLMNIAVIDSSKISKKTIGKIPKSLDKIKLVDIKDFKE